MLSKNYIVHAVTSKPFDFETIENFYWHQANSLNAVETKNLIESICPTHLLHFAWYVENGDYWNAVCNLDWLEVGLHLARCFAKNDGKRMVVSGTRAEYNWTKPSPFTEYETPFNPQTLYGARKGSEETVNLWRESSVVGG